MNKPEKKIRSYYNYHECSDYLQAKYGYDERDYADKFNRKSGQTACDDAKPYLDFWHWVLDTHEIHNGRFLTFYRADLDDPDFNAPDWVRVILGYYLDEFADENGEVEFWVSW